MPGVYEADVPAMFTAHLDQGSFGRTDRRILRFAGHGRLGQELGPEILHRDLVVVGHDRLGPFTGMIFALPGGTITQRNPR
jgi:hypothetical protein